jgi:hypothetical protein
MSAADLERAIADEAAYVERLSFVLKAGATTENIAPEVAALTPPGCRPYYADTACLDAGFARRLELSPQEVADLAAYMELEVDGLPAPSHGCWYDNGQQIAQARLPWLHEAVMSRDDARRLLARTRKSLARHRALLRERAGHINPTTTENDR